jgi:hypothetical protein
MRPMLPNNVKMSAAAIIDVTRKTKLSKPDATSLSMAIATINDPVLGNH